MATPHLAGLAGLLASQGLSNTQIRQRACDSADKISGTGTYWSCGRITPDRAVKNCTTAPPPSSAAIVNGGSESATSPWVQSSSGGYQLVAPTRPRSRSYSAYLGGYNNARDTIYQTITVPSNGTVTYWWYMSTQETTHSWDYLRVRLHNTSGSLVANLRTFSDGSGAGVWRQDSLSLSSYAGQTLRVTFTLANDGSLPTSFFIDDVSVN